MDQCEPEVGRPTDSYYYHYNDLTEMTPRKSGMWTLIAEVIKKKIEFVLEFARFYGTTGFGMDHLS